MVAVGAIEPHFYRNLCRLLDCERWSDHQLDDSVQDEVRAAFRAAFARRTRDEWVAELGPADTCVSAVYSVAEVVEDPHIASRGLIAAATHGTEGEFRQLGTLLAGTDTGRQRFDVREATVTDTDDLLAAAGMAHDRIAALRGEGVIA